MYIMCGCALAYVCITTTISMLACRDSDLQRWWGLLMPGLALVLQRCSEAASGSHSHLARQMDWWWLEPLWWWQEPQGW